MGVPLTQVHLPTEPSKKFAGKTGNGDWADAFAQAKNGLPASTAARLSK